MTTQTKSNPDWLWRIPWLGALLVTATATSAYLSDPRGEPIDWRVCGVIHATAWGALVVAWMAYRRRLRRHQPIPHLLLLTGRAVLSVSVVIVIVNLHQENFPWQLQPNAQRYYALADAIDANDLPAARAVLSHEPDPDYTPQYFRFGMLTDLQGPLDLAVHANRVAIASALLDHGATVDNTGGEKSLLVAAVQHGDLQMLRLLLRHGAAANDLSSTMADVGPPGPSQSSALWCAVSRDDTAAVELLLEHGANANTSDPDDDGRSCASGVGCTQGPEPASVLHVARAHANARITQLLVRHGAARL